MGGVRILVVDIVAYEIDIEVRVVSRVVAEVVDMC